jgi:gliding motility-associated-like protein
MLKKTLVGSLFFLVHFAVTAQVVNAPKLTCVSNGVGTNAYVRLVWSLPVITCGTFISYNIYRSTSFNGPYLLIYTETDPAITVYDDDILTVATFYYYMESNYDCPGATFLQSDTLDNLDPIPPTIEYVTVNPDGAVITWQPGASPETYGYIIYSVINGGNIPIDTVYEKNTLSYTDLNAPVNTDSASYTLASIDSCFNTGPINTLPQHTIYLTQNINRCNRTAELDWYKYNHWQPDVKQYDVLSSINEGPFTVIQTVASNVFTYTASGFNDGDSVCLMVSAVQDVVAFTSESNIVCSKFDVVQPANDFFIRKITVAAPNQVDLYFTLDSLADLLNLTIERGPDSVFFSPIATIAAPSDLSIENIYSDTTALSSQLSYYYRIIATDSCNGSDTSSIAKTVLLTGYAFSDLSFLVRWDESYLDYALVNSYELYRDDGNGFNLVTTVPETTLEYGEQNIPTVTPCYFVEAIDSLMLPNGIIDTIHSRSNVLCLNQPSQIYMPNAFAPEGKNNIFKPLLNIQNISSFNFSIFNRWGEKIFTSTDPDLGWDGKYNGAVVQQGAYAYQIVVTDENKKRIEAKGMVLVVR